MAEFHYGVKSYDFHSYYKLDTPSDLEFVNGFRELFQKEFAKELENGDCRLFKVWDHPIGPHPEGFGMFESDTKSPATFLKLLNFYQLKHGPMNVLIHPRSDVGELTDHTHHAFWLGDKLPLKTETLSNDKV